MDPDLLEMLRQANDAVRRGADPEAVSQRISEITGGQVGSLAALGEAVQQSKKAPESESIVDVERPGGARGALGAVLRGVTLGGSDELGAAVRAAPRLVPGGRSFGESFEENVEAARQGQAMFREEHPVISTGLNIGGAVAPAVATAPLFLGRAGAAGAGAGAKIGLGRLMAAGAAEGAVAGGLEAEGGVRERAGSAAVGAGIGAATGGILPLVGRGLGRLGGRALDIANIRPRGGSSGIIGRLGQRLGIQSVDERAAARVADALPEGEALETATRQLTETTRPLTLMDVDENVAGVARAARGVEGPAKRELPAFLAGRTAGQEARVLDDALKLTGVGERASIFETTQEIVERRAAQARPLYEAAYERTVPREVLGDVLDDPAFRDAYERGVRIAARDGVDLAPVSQMLPEGSMGPQEIPVQAIDYMKRGLDDAIEAGMRSSRGMGRQEARGLRNQLRSMLERVDEAVPEYGEARAAFAGESRLLEALEQGRDLFKLDPAEARAIIGELPESEREMFVRGGLEAMAERVENASASFDITRRRPLADRTRDRQRLRLLFPDDKSFQQFQRSIAEEAQIARTSNFVRGGSNTAEKLMEMAEMTGVNLSTIASGNVTGALGQLLSGAVRSRSKGFTGDLGESMLPLLTAEGPAGADVIRRLSALRSGVGRELSLREARAAGVLGATAGASTSRRDRDR